MSKIIPPGVEATMFAITATLINLSLFILCTMTGSVVNDLFVGVTRDSLDRYYILNIILMVLKTVPLILVYRLVPKNEEVAALQE